jgi:hypothetical protein
VLEGNPIWLTVLGCNNGNQAPLFYTWLTVCIRKKYKLSLVIHKGDKHVKNGILGQEWWVVSIILATQEAEIRRIVV